MESSVIYLHAEVSYASRTVVCMRAVEKYIYKSELILVNR